MGYVVITLDLYFTVVLILEDVLQSDVRLSYEKDHPHQYLVERNDDIPALRTFYVKISVKIGDCYE